MSHRPEPQFRPRATAASALCGVALAVAGCAGAPKPAPPASPPKVEAPPPPAPEAAPPPAAPAITAQPGLSPRERIQRALQLLGDGDAPTARAEVTAFLAEQPDNALGKSLLAQIDTDPKELLGSESFSYKAQPGESLSSIAERFLGDRFKFYALARYNGIAAPAKMEVGQELQIPGTRPATPRRASRASDQTEVERRVGETRPSRPAPPPPAAPRRDPGRAARLRRSALSQLQGGAVDAAVRTLEQASQLDPDSDQIRRDLDRARRIQATLHHR